MYGEINYWFNRIRSYTIILQSELIEIEVLDFKPLKEIGKRKTIKRIRVLPTRETRKKIL